MCKVLLIHKCHHPLPPPVGDWRARQPTWYIIFITLLHLITLYIHSPCDFLKWARGELTAVEESWCWNCGTLSQLSSDANFLASLQRLHGSWILWNTILQIVTSCLTECQHGVDDAPHVIPDEECNVCIGTWKRF